MVIIIDRKLELCVCGCELKTVPLMSATGFAAAAPDKSRMYEMILLTAT
jgi:hypothetical protein